MEEKIRIKGKWIGQIVVDAHVDLTEDEFNRRNFEQDKSWFSESVTSTIKKVLEDTDGSDEEESKVTITVTQLHADLYRDEPSEWTKEEAT